MSTKTTTLVFVYGSLLSGLLNSKFLNTAKLLGEFTTPPSYKMFDLGMFPCIVRGGDTPIKGEIYQVDEETFAVLDRLEGHPDFYRRSKINTDQGKAWVYLYPDDVVGGDRVDDGDWRAHRAVF